MTKHNLRRQKTLTRDGVIPDVTVEYKSIMGKRKGKGDRQAFSDGD